MAQPHQRRQKRPPTCQTCDRPIEQASIGRPRLYCRQSCRQRAYERRRIARAVTPVAQERDVLRGRLLTLRARLDDLTTQVMAYAWGYPGATAPDPYDLSVAIVEVAYPGLDWRPIVSPGAR